MTLFSYKAKSASGQTVSGEVQAPTIGQAANLLREKKLVIISLRPARPSLPLLWARATHLVRHGDVVALTRQLATMVAAGLPLTDALRILRSQSHPATGLVMSSVLDDVEGGMSLADALSKHRRVFSPVYIALVRAGEAGGMLDGILKRLADTLEQQKEFGSRVKQAMVYPVIVIIGMAVASFIMMVFVVPKLTEIYQGFGTELPLPTKVLIAVSTTLARYWLLLVSLLGLFLLLLFYWLKTATGKEVFDTYLFRVPVLGRLRLNVILTEFTRTLGMLINAGIPLIEGLRITADAVGNFLIRREILAVATHVEKGLPLSVPFSQGEYFPPILGQMISVGEETGQVDDVLLKLAGYFEGESRQSVSALTAAIEPLIMIVLGVGVGFLVIAIILPIYSLQSAF